MELLYFEFPKTIRRSDLPPYSHCLVNSSVVMSSVLRRITRAGSVPTPAMIEYCKEMDIPIPDRIEHGFLGPDNDNGPFGAIYADVAIPSACRVEYWRGSALLLMQKSYTNGPHLDILGGISAIWFIALTEGDAHAEKHGTSEPHSFIIGTITTGSCDPCDSTMPISSHLLAFEQDPYAAMKVQSKNSFSKEQYYKSFDGKQ